MDESQEFSLWDVLVLIINYVIGAGILSIPWAYSQGGLIVGILSQVLVTLFSTILTYQILQTMSRVSTINQLISEGYSISPVSCLQIFKKTSPSDFISHHTEGLRLIKDSDLEIPEQNITFTEMISLVMGKTHAFIFCLSFCFSVIINLMAYASIFGTSLVSIIPIFSHSTCDLYDDSEEFGSSCWIRYWTYLFILLNIIGILVLVQLKEQKWFQEILAVMRLAVIFLVLLTCSIALIQDKNLADSERNRGKLVLINASKVGVTFPVILFANYFHVFIPNAIQWLSSKSKKAVMVLNIGNFSISFLYCLVGVIVPLAVYDVKEMMTLEWENYTGGQSERSWWSDGILYFIILFPALDILSIFPLAAINLSDNIMPIFSIKQPVRYQYTFSFVFCRLAVVIVPILISAFFFNLGIINNISGIITIIYTGIYMPLLIVSCKKIVPQKTEYDSYFAHDFYSWLVFVFHVGLFLLCTVLLIIWLTDNN